MTKGWVRGRPGAETSPTAPGSASLRSGFSGMLGEVGRWAGVQRRCSRDGSSVAPGVTRARKGSGTRRHSDGPGSRKAKSPSDELILGK